MVDLVFPGLLRVKVALGLSIAVGTIGERIVGVVAFDCPCLGNF